MAAGAGSSHQPSVNLFYLILCVLFNIICDLEMAASLQNDALLDGIEKPFFDDISPRNVSAIVDDTTVLKCRVKNKTNRTVSWIRKRDLHILTTNIFTYTGDQRFSVMHTPDSDDWDLKIEYVQQRDSGIYECQVNTEPKINFAVQLDVIGFDSSGGIAGLDQRNAVTYINGKKAARAKIIGSLDIHVKRGTTISISCVVNVHAPTVSWFHGTSIVDFDSARGGISLETEKTESGTSSRLMLTRAVPHDSGNYTCSPAGAVSASVHVHVLNGEHPAAMQVSSNGPAPSKEVILFLCIFCVYICHQTTISRIILKLFGRNINNS